MKTFLTLSILFLAISAEAKIDLAKLAGSYAGTCTQSQDGTKQGSLIETYKFSEGGKIVVTKDWYKDSKCSESKETTSEEGTFKIGKERTGDTFVPAGTYEANYVVGGKTELGLIWVDSNYSKLRVARAFGAGRNTMLGVFQYSR